MYITDKNGQSLKGGKKVYNKNVMKYLWFMLLGNKESGGSGEKRKRFECSSDMAKREAA